MSRSGTLYRLLVTYVVLGVTAGSYLYDGELHEMSQSGLLPFVASEKASSLFGGGQFTPGSSGLDSSQLYEDGAAPSAPLIRRQRGGDQIRLRRIADNGEGLDTAAQAYYIEPALPTTTTKRPTFKKRKTRRPITSLAEKKQPQKEKDIGNVEVVPQGSPVGFNPFKQIVNTSFGRKRPSEGKQDQERPRGRARKQGGDVTPTEPSDSLNEVPTSTEGEPRVLGRRRPAQDVRPVAGPSSFNDNFNEPRPAGRLPKRIPRPGGAAPGAPVSGGRRQFKKPRLTTTPPSSEAGPTEINIGVTQPEPPKRPVRPPGVSRFTNANRNPPTDIASPPPPPEQPRRRPLRPTTTAQATTEGADIAKNVVFATPPPASDLNGVKPSREFGARPGFTLRPFPGSQSSKFRQVTQDEVVVTSSPVNRRRKRPIANPTPVSPSQPESVGNENVVPRRKPLVMRTRPSSTQSSLPSTGRPAYEVREDPEETPQPMKESVVYGTPMDFARPQPPHHSELSRRPISLSHQSYPSHTQHYVSNPAEAQPDFSEFGILAPKNLVANPSPFDNGIGIPANNYQSVQYPLLNNQFSQRITPVYEHPEISDSTFAGSTEKEAVAVAPPKVILEAIEATTTTTQAPEKERKMISPLERLQQNRQAAARRFLTPRKPTEKTTPAPAASPVQQIPGKSLRKSLIPPRILRARGKAQAPIEEVKIEEEKVEGDSNDGKETTAPNEVSTPPTDNVESNVVPISDADSQKKPASLLENARRRRIPVPGRSPNYVQQKKQEQMKITPAPPADHNPDASQPNCEDGQRFSKFLKRCVTMYKPKTVSQG